MKARRWWIWAPVAVLVLLASIWAGLKFTRTGKQAEVAAGYVAHVVCSCRYAGNRDLNSCKTDFEPGMEVVEVADDPARRRVTARVPLFARRTAVFDPEYGCTLDAG